MSAGDTPFVRISGPPMKGSRSFTTFHFWKKKKWMKNLIIFLNKKKYLQRLNEWMKLSKTKNLWHVNKLFSRNWRGGKSAGPNKTSFFFFFPQYKTVKLAPAVTFQSAAERRLRDPIRNGAPLLLARRAENTQIQRETNERETTRRPRKKKKPPFPQLRNLIHSFHQKIKISSDSSLTADPADN